MALFHISAVISQISIDYRDHSVVIEDPNPRANRLFFSTIGHDATYLNPIANTVFHFNTPMPYGTIQSPPEARKYGYGGKMFLQKASINCFAGSGLTNDDQECYSAFHRSLDPKNYPARRAWNTVNNRNIFCFNGIDYGDQNAAEGTHYYQIYPSDITQGYLYTAGSTNFPNILFYEDPINNKLWGMGTGAPMYPIILYMSNYDNPAAVTGNRPTSGRRDSEYPYFIGPDVAGNTYWASPRRAAGDPFALYSYSANGTPIFTTIINGITTGGGTWYSGKPSNIRYDNSSTRVFYTCQFDGLNELKPYRITWNPQNTSLTGQNNFTATTCTMVYSIGTFSNYCNPFTVTGNGTYGGENWHYQPWQFKPSSTSTWYITFWPSDKTTNTLLTNSGPQSTNSRWANPLQRTMMTYSINTTTDSITTATLRYHSSYTFSSPIEIPRDWLPINDDGTLMAVPVTSKVNFFSFNPITGWGVTSSYPYEMRQMGLDSENRLWGLNNEIGNWAVHLITPTAPYTVSVVMPTQSFSYTGTNILTTASIYAHDVDGNPYALAVNLKINGNSMLFTDNGLTSLTTTTSVTSARTVNLTVFGGGVNNIVVDMVG